MENNETQVQNTGDTVVAEQTQAKVDTEPKKVQNEADKRFTQDEVNNIVVGRLNSLYNGYGVKDKAELDALFQKATLYDDTKARYDALENEHRGIAEKLLFMENNINPARYDDVRAYFKGKELVFNAENLKKEIETHNEWLNVAEKPVATIKAVGNIKQTETKENDKDKAMKLFGF